MNMTLAKKLFIVLVLALPVIAKANTEFKFTPRAKLEAQISESELNRIEVNGGDIMEVVGDEGKYSLYWSSDWRNLFIKPKVPTGETFELSLIFFGGLAQDIRFTAGDTTAKTVRINLSSSETSKTSLQLETAAMMKAMLGDVGGKYYVTETNRAIKTTPQLQSTQIKAYRYKDLNGAVAIVKNISKSSVNVTEEDFSRLFKDTLAITLKSFDLAPKVKTFLFIVLQKKVQMINKLKSWWQTIARFFMGQDKEMNSDESLLEGAETSKEAKRKQNMVLAAIFGLGLVGTIGWNVFTSYRATQKHKETKESVPFKLDIASSALDPDKMWRNLFEDKLAVSKEETNKKLELIETSLNEASLNQQTQLKAEVDKLKAQLQFLTDEQESSKRDLSNIKLKSENQEEYKAVPSPVQESHIEINHMGRGEVFDRPKSARNFIPEGVYVKGVLLGGIVVSTSQGSSAEPVPVVIRVTDGGNLPKNFNMDLSKCKIIGSSYGDLSSERAIIRAETLTCTDASAELIYTTKVAGLIYGDDGMNGIKGRVIQTSCKHLKNAIVGGMISGFASSAKGQDSMFITGNGAMNTKKKGFTDMATEGAFSGASNAAEKIADYYIKQAESMSPVLLISGGTKVDVLFTKGVYFGALDIQERLEQARKDKTKERVTK